MTMAEMPSEEQARPTVRSGGARRQNIHAHGNGRQRSERHPQPEGDGPAEQAARDGIREAGMVDDAGERGELRALAAALFPAREELPRVPQQARSREKRDEILKAAAALFVERGYAGTTSDDIAAAAGVSVGTFYNYFRNKRQVLVTLVIARLEDIFGNLQLARLDFSLGYHHRAIIRDAIAAAMGGSQQGLRRVWMELMSLEPELVPYQQIIRRYVLTQLEANLRAARDKGETWPDLDVEATALAIFSLLDTIGMRHDADQQISADRVIETLTNFVYRSVFPPDASEVALTSATTQEKDGA
ncbi:MAG: TetR/AcrR family transcriptional regulator [Ktedonobacterales bacterium]